MALKQKKIIKYVFLFSIIFVKNICKGQSEADSTCSSTKTKWIKNYFAKNAKQSFSQPFYTNNIDVSYYHLDLSLSFEQKNINGKCTIKATNLTSNMDSIYFDLTDNLKVDSIKINNQKVNFTHKQNIIKINLARQLQKNEQFSTIIFYQGSPLSSGYGTFVFSERNNKKDKAIWSLSEPFGASDWFPCKNNVEDKADSSDVWITADKYFVSVSNGILTDVIENTNNTKTYKWKNRYPIAQYLISIAMSNYLLYEKTFEYNKLTMPIVHYVYAETLNDALKKQLDVTEKALQIFSDRFGIYPFMKEKYGHAQFGWGGGMEHQTCSSMGGFSEGLIAHELAHQWFGDKITCKNWENIWLNEGFASYSECIYSEETYGKTNYQFCINNKLKSAKNAQGSIYVQSPTNIASIFNSSRTYSKGAVVLHMLRGIVGKETFYNIIKTYTSDKSIAYGSATTDDFRRISEKVYGKDLTYFFDEWIYKEGFPKYFLSWSSDTLPNGSLKVNLKIDQKIKPNTFDYFKMPIELKFTNKITNDSITKTIWNDSRNQTYEFIVSEKTEIAFDPENLILKDTVNIPSILFTPSYALPLANEPTTDQRGLISISPNPIYKNYLNKATINLYVEKPSFIECYLYNAKGQKIQTLINKLTNKGIVRLNKLINRNITEGKYIILCKINNNIISTNLIIK